MSLLYHWTETDQELPKGGLKANLFITTVEKLSWCDFFPNTVIRIRSNSFL